MFEAAAEATGQAEKAGIEGGMNLKITLTTMEKIMNMAKLGTVSLFKIGQQLNQNPRQQRDCGLLLYTLCVY